MRIWIRFQLFTLMQIRILLITLIWIRMRILKTPWSRFHRLHLTCLFHFFMKNCAICFAYGKMIIFKVHTAPIYGLILTKFINYFFRQRSGIENPDPYPRSTGSETPDKLKSRSIVFICILWKKSEVYFLWDHLSVLCHVSCMFVKNF